MSCCLTPISVMCKNSSCLFLDPNKYVALDKINFVFTFCFVYCFQGAGIAQSVQRPATGWTVLGSNPGGARFSAPVQTGPETHPASYTMGAGSFPGV